MDYCFSTLRQICCDISTHKLRSFFSILSIAWGIYALILLLAIGEGIITANTNNLHRISKPVVFIRLLTMSISKEGMPANQRIWLSEKELLALPQQVAGIKELSLVFTHLPLTISANGQEIKAPVLGKMPNSIKLETEQLIPGSRYFNVLDMRENHRVVILSNFVKQKLFGAGTALGQAVYLNGLPFIVIGVIDTRNRNNNLSINGSNVIIPYTTARELWNRDGKDYVEIELLPNVNINTFLKHLRLFLAHYYQFSPKDKNVLYHFSLTGYKSNFKLMLMCLELFLGFCGIMILTVGGISVVNTVYLIMRERIPEIGLKIALGAKPLQIKQQFFLESGLLVILGGLTGFIMSYITINTLTNFTLPIWMGTPRLTIPVILLIWLVLGLTALLTGNFPANKAIQVDPISSLQIR